MVSVLEDFEYGKDIVCAWVALWSQHSVDAFTVFTQFFCQVLKTDSRIDIVAQYRFACIDIAI